MRLLHMTIGLGIAATVLLTNCKKKEETPQPSTPTALEVKTFRNLHAPQTGGGGTGQPIGGAFKKFSFAKGDTVTDGNWDIAFRGLIIILNGGTKTGLTDEPDRTGNAAANMLTGVLLENIQSVPETDNFKQDAVGVYAIPTGSGNGWYNYSSSTHLVTPIAGRVFVIRTHDGKYAKMEFLSYYKDAPAKPTADHPSRYYTFRYVYQPNGKTF